MAGQRFGQPIHASRCLALHGVRVSDRIQRTEGGWGQSVLQRALQPLATFRTTWGYLGASMKRFSETWLQMAGLTDLIAGGKDKVVKDRLAILSLMRSALKIAPIDGKDQVVELGLQLAGVADVVEKAMETLCAASEMPATVLFGGAPGGLSTDDVSGDRNWSNAVAQRQRRVFLAPINYLIEILLAAKDLRLKKPERYQVVFRPLAEPTDKEVAEVEKSQAETVAIYVQTQVLDPAEARETLRADPRSRFKLAEQDEPDAPDAPELDPEDPDAPTPKPGETPPGAPAPAAGAEKAQDTALNGAQTGSLREILKDVARREMDRDSGIEALMLSFNIDRPRAEQLMGKTGVTFFIDAPEPIAPGPGARPPDAPPSPAAAPAKPPPKPDEE